MGMPEHVHPFPIFLVPEIGPDDDTLFRITTLQSSMVGDLTESDHSIACRKILNMVNLSMDRLKGGKELFPSLAHFVDPPMEFASRRNKEYAGTARKQSHHLFRVEQSVAFEELVVQFLVSVSTSLGKAFAVCAADATVPAKRNDKMRACTEDICTRALLSDPWIVVRGCQPSKGGIPVTMSDAILRQQVAPIRRV